MIIHVVGFFVFVFVWVIGLVIFKGLLSLDGVWLMLAGAFTFMAADVARESIEGE